MEGVLLSSAKLIKGVGGSLKGEEEEGGGGKIIKKRCCERVK